MSQVHQYRPGDHRSRREIDLAVGALIGLRGCSAEEAMEALVDATRASGVGLGGVSHTLLSVISGNVEPTAADAALEHWQAVLRLPNRHAL